MISGAYRLAYSMSRTTLLYEPSAKEYTAFDARYGLWP